MRKYKVALTRVYFVTVRAANMEKAKDVVEFYLGDCPDRSNETHRREEKFKIEDIELALNEAYEASLMRNSDEFDC